MIRWQVNGGPHEQRARMAVALSCQSEGIAVITWNILAKEPVAAEVRELFQWLVQKNQWDRLRAALETTGGPE